MGALSGEAYSNMIRAINERFEAHRAMYIVRSWAWYLLLPLCVYAVFSPGFIFSVPAVEDCDDGLTKPIAPGRVTGTNLVVALFAFYLPLTIFIFWLGAQWDIDFPFQKNVLMKYAMGRG